MSDRIRLTISVTPEVHEVFSRMAETSGMSLGKCMGDWLTDTIEGAQFVATKMAEARSAPKTVMREFQAMTRGLVDEVDSAVDQLRKGGWQMPARGGGAGTGGKRPAALPPSSPTGVNTPAKRPAKTRRRP